VVSEMDASEAEDLVSNPFFVTLKRQFASLYNVAEEHCYTICIPSSQSIGNAVPAKKDVGASEYSKQSRAALLSH
jgi:hypothetical protein